MSETASSSPQARVAGSVVAGLTTADLVAVAKSASLTPESDHASMANGSAGGEGLL